MRPDELRHSLPISMLPALVLLLGAAAPAIAQSPSAGEPLANLGRPLTIEELDETRIAVGMTGDQVVVVAEATVYTDQVDTDPACDPAASACPYGRLIGLATDDVVEVDARADVAAQFPDGVTGSLALSLVGSGVELLGFLTQTGAYTVPVSPEGFAGQDKMEPGTLIAVDGWLQVLGLAVPCPSGRGLSEDSPFVLCPAGWITAEPFFPPTDDDGIPMQPPGFGIIVQPNAYEDSAPDPQRLGGHATEPRRAVYLLRRVAVSVPELGEMAGWQVIARLDAID